MLQTTATSDGVRRRHQYLNKEQGYKVVDYFASRNQNMQVTPADTGSVSKKEFVQIFTS